MINRTTYLCPEPLEGQVGNMDGSLGAGLSSKYGCRNASSAVYRFEGS